MKCCVLFSFFFLLIFGSTQTADAQSVPVSDKAVFYNFDVIKCSGSDCKTPYIVTLGAVRTINGSFKGLNNRVTSVREPGSFLVQVYEKRTGKMEWETVTPNPVSVNIEYDAHTHAHSHESGGTLQRKIIEQEQGSIAIRLPFEPHECIITVSYIDAQNSIIELANF